MVPKRTNRLEVETKQALLVVGGHAEKEARPSPVLQHLGPLLCLRVENGLGGPGSCLQRKSDCFIFVAGVHCRTGGQFRRQEKQAHGTLRRNLKGPPITLPHCPFWIFTPEHGTGKFPGSNTTLRSPWLPPSPCVTSVWLTLLASGLHSLFMGTLKEWESLENSWALPAAGRLF